MSDIKWTETVPNFRDRLEWWRLRLSEHTSPFVVAVETCGEGGGIGVLFPGLAYIVEIEDIPAGILWGGRVDMGEPSAQSDGDMSTNGAPAIPAGWEIDPDCAPSPTGQPWTAESWGKYWTAAQYAEAQERGESGSHLQDFAGAEGIPVWRSSHDVWHQTGVNARGEHHSPVSAPGGPLLPIRKVTQ